MPITCAASTTLANEGSTQKRTATPSSSGTSKNASSAGSALRSATRSRASRRSISAIGGSRRRSARTIEDDLDCEFCGQCVSVCPTGALTGKQWARKGRYQDVTQVDTVCAFCGTGCNITAHVKNNEIIRITSKPDTWNDGWLCVKGRFGYQYVNSPDRLTKPLITARCPVRRSHVGRGLRLYRREAQDDQGQARRRRHRRPFLGTLHE